MLPERLRTFIALELPDDIRENIWRAECALKAAVSDGVRWVARENLHVTVKFLGMVYRETIPEVLEAMRRGLAECSQVTVPVRGVELFPPGRRPHVLSVGVHRDQRLEAIYQALERKLAHLGIKKEHRGYLPHVTLGRLEQSAVRVLEAFDFSALGDNMGTLPVTHVSLFMSELGRGGPIYTRLGSVPVGG